MKLTRLSTLILSLITLPAAANLPYYPIQLPRDDAAHYANTPYTTNRLTEWWYYNGKITTANARHFGYFIAAFRIQMMPHVQTTMLIMQLTDIDNQKVYGKTVNYAGKEVSFNTQELAINLANDFTLNKNDETYQINDVASMQDGTLINLSLNLTPTKPPLLIEKTGLIDMWLNTNSYYYSNTRLQTSGTIAIGKEQFVIDPTNSTSWMDHQWGDFMLNVENAQWVWMSIQLENGMDLNVYELVNHATHKIVRSYGNVILPDDTRFYTTDLTLAHETQKAPHYPQNYKVTINPLDLQLNLDSLEPDQDSNGFWDGIHQVKGTYQGKPISGFAYVESTVQPE